MPQYTDAHGIEIHYDVHLATAPVRGAIQLLHGVGEHAGRYGALVEVLTAAGFHVYADDHRGHGRTGLAQWGGDASRLGRLGPGGMPATVAALWQFTELIRAENLGLPLVLFGHSWGSFLAQMLLNMHPEAYDAMILSGSALRMPGSLNARPLNARWNRPGAHGLEWLSNDPAVWGEFRADPLTTETPLLKLFGLRDAARLYGRPRKHLPADVPVLLLVGADDPVGGPVSVHRLAKEYRERSGLHDVTTLVYPGQRHEILNDTAQAQVRDDIVSWLDEHIPKPE